MRLFVALDLPAPGRDAAARIAGELREAGAQVRWVRPELLHCTLCFLGEVPPEQGPAIGERLAAVARETRPFGVAMAGCGVFGRPRRPEVVWLGAAAGRAELAALAAACGKALGIPENRKAAPHLTLGRVSGLRNREQLLAAVAARAKTPVCAFRAAEIALKESTLTPAGPVYRDVRVFRLGR